MYVNVIKSYRDVVAICDSELIGKKFEEGELQLDVKESFYKGEQVDEEKLLNIIDFHKQEDATFNIVGEKSINLALKEGIIQEEAIKKIQGIPYVFVLI